MDGLNDDQYKLYKKLRASEKAKQTNSTKSDFYPTFLHIQDLIKQGNEEEAQSIVDSMSDEEYKAYKS